MPADARRRPPPPGNRRPPPLPFRAGSANLRSCWSFQPSALPPAAAPRARRLPPAFSPLRLLTPSFRTAAGPAAPRRRPSLPLPVRRKEEEEEDDDNPFVTKKKAKAAKREKGKGFAE